jgi:hypothetical protein
MKAMVTNCIPIPEEFGESFIGLARPLAGDEHPEGWDWTVLVRMPTIDGVRNTVMADLDFIGDDSAEWLAGRNFEVLVASKTAPVQKILDVQPIPEGIS